MAGDHYDDGQLPEDFRCQSTHRVSAYANGLAAQIAAGKLPAGKLVDTQRLIFNQRLDAAVTAVLALMVIVLIIEALLQWYAILSSRRAPVLHESPYVPTQWAEVSPV